MGVCLEMQFAQLHCELCLQLEELCLAFQSWLLVEQTVLKQCYSSSIVEHLLSRYLQQPMDSSNDEINFPLQNFCPQKIQLISFDFLDEK